MAHNRGLACLSYLPLPGVAWLVARSAPKDRLVRHHSRQAGLVVALFWLLLLGLGLLLKSPALEEGLAPVLGIIVALALVGLGSGFVSAARGRFLRIRPLWDAIVAASGRPSPRSRST